MSMPGFYPSRSASLAITIFGAITNFALAVQVLTAWRSLKWEPESEWEESGGSWQVDGVKVIWALLSTYFASAATVCVVGFMGIIKRKPTFIRFYRDYSIADFSFCTFATAIATYAVFHASARTAICEELSHHPELMRDLAEMGLNLENCERWLERAVFASVALMVVIIVVRLHFLLAVANLYSQLTRHMSGHTRSHSRFRHQDLNSLQRIYILPRSSQQLLHTGNDDDVELVYAPVSLSSIPEDLRGNATEAWVSHGRRHSRALSEVSREYHSCDQQELSHPHRHHRRHSHSHSHEHHRQSSRSTSCTRTGTIRLPILPDEGLLPPYSGDENTKA